MPDIFISYRHGKTDPWIARNLETHLTSPYSVFLDKNPERLDFGDRFREEIDDALATCRVLIAVIGSDWVAKRNVRRLHDPHDWITYELSTALRRGGEMRIVPVVMDTAMNALNKADLPAALEPLRERNRFPLTEERGVWDCLELRARLPKWLERAAAGYEVEPQLPPSLLPYLCDRREQEDALWELGRASSRGLMACVVHGHKAEAHDELLERFCGGGVLGDVFECRDDGPVPWHALVLNPAKLMTGAFEATLKDQLKLVLLRTRSAPEAELRQYLSNLPQALVFVVQVTWGQYTAVGEGMLIRLLAAWHSLLDDPLGGPALSPLHPALLWINLTYDDTERELGREVLREPLPKLQAIEEQHIKEWLTQPSVRPYVQHTKQKILALPSQMEYCHAPGRLHMTVFAETVQSLISVR